MLPKVRAAPLHFRIPEVIIIKVNGGSMMKKLSFALVFFFVFAALTPLFAQKISKEHESEYYYVNRAIEKIYPYRAGYIIVYRKGVNQMARVYIPGEWFSEAAGKGELVTLPPGKNWPSQSVYYKEGEFSHLKLFIHRWKGHSTWGNVPSNVNIDDRFEGIENIELEF